MNILSIDRRTFLRGSAALGAAMVVAGGSARAQTKVMRAQSNFQIEVLDPASPSFQTTLDENPSLDIEPYFIRFEDQGRAIQHR